jgi:O-antigen ligase
MLISWRIKDSFIFKLLLLIKNQKLAWLMFIMSIIFFWYEQLFINIGVGVVSTLNLATICLGLAFLLCDKSRIANKKSLIFLLIFFVIVFASACVAIVNGLSANMIGLGMVLLSQFLMAVIFGVTISSNIRPFMNTIFLVSLPTLVYGVFQGLFGGNTSRMWVSSAEDLVTRRAFGWFGSPNIMGSIALLLAIMSLVFWLVKRKDWWYLGYGLLSVFVMILTFSRSAILAFGLSVVVGLAVFNWRLLFITPSGLLLLLIPNVRQRILVAASQSYINDSALDGRVWASNSATEIVKISPIIGTGPGSYGGDLAVQNNSPIYLQGMQNGYVALPYTDNQWLQIFVQTGFLGAISFGLFLAGFFINNLASYRRSGDMVNLGMVSVVVAIFINGLFANILEFGSVSVLAGAIMGIGINYGQKNCDSL